MNKFYVGQKVHLKTLDELLKQYNITDYTGNPADLEYNIHLIWKIPYPGVIENMLPFFGKMVVVEENFPEKDVFRYGNFSYHYDWCSTKTKISLPDELFTIKL